MKLNQFFVFNAVLAVIIGVSAVLVPGPLMGLYGTSARPDINAEVQLLGTTLLAVGLVCWFARNVSDSAAQKALLRAFLIADGIGLVVVFINQLSGVYNAFGWSTVILYLVLCLGYAYFLFIKK